MRDDNFFAMADRRYAVVAMEIEHKSLENVFLTLTGDAPTEQVDEDDDNADSGEEELV